MSKTRELKLKVYESVYGSDLVYDADISSWMFKNGEYHFVEKSAYDEIKAELSLAKQDRDSWHNSFNTQKAAANDYIDSLAAKSDKLLAALEKIFILGKDGGAYTVEFPNDAMAICCKALDIKGEPFSIARDEEL